MQELVQGSHLGISCNLFKTNNEDKKMIQDDISYPVKNNNENSQQPK